MAATSFTPISLYYSTTASAAPTAGNLVAGELALNTADGKLFYKDSSNVVQVIGTKGGVGTSSTTQVLYNTSGLVVGSANLTFNGTTLTTANDASISGLTVGKGGGAVSSNTALGYNSLSNVSQSGTQNFAAGWQVLTGNTSGSNNVGTGAQTLFSNTTGSSNSGYGTNALPNNTTGSFNVAVGQQALNANTTASNNTAVGYQAGYTQTANGSNTYLGYQAGLTATGNYNTFIGQSCGNVMTTGTQNVILGAFSGNAAGLDIRTASNYIVLSDGGGNPRGYCDGSGSWNFSATVASEVGTFRNYAINAYGVAVVSYVSVANTAALIRGFAGTTPAAVFNVAGNGNVTNTNNSYGAISDIKLKENIVDATPKLDDLCKVKVRQYNLKSDPDHKQIGVVAQELEEVFAGLVDESKDADSDGKDLGTTTKTVKYSVFVPMLIKAVQELNAKVTALEAQLSKPAV